MDFLAARGTQFSTRLTGANCYYLPYKSPRMVEATLDAARYLGLNVIRTWAFENSNGSANLDFVIAAAAARDIRLILPLVNNWPDFGGIPAYQERFGLPAHQDFYADSRARAGYRDWCRTVIERHRDNPTIAAWELTNEARNDNAGSAILIRWMDEMSRYIKSLDPNHLIAAGDEGFFNRLWPRDQFHNGSHGTDFDQFLQLEAIDFGTMHLYEWDYPTDASYGCRWIERHANAGTRWSKPVILEEYGWRETSRRDEFYGAWLNTVRDTNLAADLFWMLATDNDDGTPYYDDGYTLYPATVPTTIREHVRASTSRSSALL